MRFVAIRVFRWVASAPPPTDPLGPVDQDPEQIRNEACKLVSSNPSACITTPTTRPTQTSSGGGIDLSWMSLLLWLLLIGAVVAIIVLLLRRPLSRAVRDAGLGGSGGACGADRSL